MQCKARDILKCTGCQHFCTKPGKRMWSAAGFAMSGQNGPL